MYLFSKDVLCSEHDIGLPPEQTNRNIAVVLCPGGGLLPYMGHIGMCRCEGYGFQAVYSSIGYINQSVWV